MSGIVLDAIDAEIAALAREVPTPTGDLGYGRDLSCVTGLSPDLAEVDPQSPRAIGQAVLRRITTRRGALPDDPSYGVDVRAYANRGTTRTERLELAGVVRLEAAKDDRVEDLVVEVTEPEPHTLDVTITITPADPRIRPFRLVFAVTPETLTVEELG